MKWNKIVMIFGALALSTQGFANHEHSQKTGVVDIDACVSQSKYGKQERTSFEMLDKQMSSLLEDTKKQIQEISAKLNDSEYLDGLSPQAVEELKVKFNNLREELDQYQNRYYQVMNQAHMKLVETMTAKVNAAAEVVAAKEKLGLVLNKHVCFFTSKPLEITELVREEMDHQFEKETKQKTAAQVADTKMSEAAK